MTEMTWNDLPLLLVTVGSVMIMVFGLVVSLTKFWEWRDTKIYSKESNEAKRHE